MINIKMDILKLMNDLGEVKSKQLPFAMKKALDRLAISGREVMAQEYRGELTIRNKGLLRKGIQVNFANKRDWPFIRSEVGVLDDFGFMADHVTGMERQARSSKGRAIPTKDQTSKRMSSGKMPNNQKPFALLNRKGSKAFLIMAKNNGRRLIAERIGKERRAIKVLYGFSKNAKIRDNVGLQSAVEIMFNKSFNRILGEELARAIATKKK
jgi:hypothetical protein